MLFDVLIDGKIFFDVPVRNKEEAYEKIIEISKKNNYTTGNLLDYENFSKLVAINLSKQIKLENLDSNQEINFISKLVENEVKKFFIIENSEETTLEFSQNFGSII